ncbi:carboxypeptidase regulatory-like domain-containing protein [Calothrix sp. UHCC 0171]|uniref:carboxypeptidase regulatory-like domain-containing protein n=1 Tax=Calothrix sp. UHCC 0171 TaxID=3110245 RepID=UPI002B1EEAA2|nr:carboxypeptidase regulatory-like domain-containing protein [Calothrix sp. UHCC 0171]MEA5572933.1 carboxypeptidase regulatory-like domain-containing protein [Calothrix sp. UHCC 0171]
MAKKNTINYIGRVIDYEKQAPIRGAKVSLNTDEISLVSYTDLEGIYRFQVNPDKAKDVRGEISVEASGYRTYQYSIWLSSDKKDLGDVRLGDFGGSNTSIASSNSSSSRNHNSSSNSNSNSNSNLIAIAAIIMIAFFIFVSLSMRNSNRGDDIDDNGNSRRERSDLLNYQTQSLGLL